MTGWVRLSLPVALLAAMGQPAGSAVGPVGTPSAGAAAPLRAATSRVAVAPIAGSQGLTVVRSAAISQAVAGSRYVEPWLAVNPTNADNLIAAAMNLGGGEMRSTVWASHDGGHSWARARRGEGGEDDFADGDPMIAFGPDGTAYFTTLADGFSVWRSHDGGTSWGRPARVPGGSYDRQWVAVDHSGGPFHGRVYAAGKIWIKVFGSITRDLMAVARSDDGVGSFAWPQLLLPDPGQEVLHTVTDLLVTDDGALLVPFLTFFWNGPRAGPGDGRLRGRFSVVRSEDGGRSFSDLFEVASMRSFGHAEPDLSNKALGGGRLVVDRSDGRFSGRLYLAWVEAVDRALHIMVTTSADGGRNWTDPTRVDDGAPDAVSSNPAIAVNRDGIVLVTWNDRRADPTGRCFVVHGAASMDGGETFSGSIPIGNGRACLEGRFANGGDTQGLVALPDGRFVAAWIRDAAGGTHVWSSTLEVPSR